MAKSIFPNRKRRHFLVLFLYPITEDQVNEMEAELARRREEAE